MEVTVGGEVAQTLVDTGSTLSLVSSRLVQGLSCQKNGVMLEMMDWSRIKTRGSVQLQSIRIGDQELGPLQAQVLHTPPGGVDIVLGLDIVLQHGLVVVVKDNKIKVQMGNVLVVDQAQKKLHQDGDQRKQMLNAPLRVQPWSLEAEDFQAWFQDGHWTMKWQWKDWPPAGKTQVCNYKVPEDAQEGFDREIQLW